MSAACEECLSRSRAAAKQGRALRFVKGLLFRFTVHHAHDSPGVYQEAPDPPPSPRKVDVRLPEKGNSNSHGAKPVLLVITMIKWIRTSRSSIKNSLSENCTSRRGGGVRHERCGTPTSSFTNFSSFLRPTLPSAETRGSHTAGYDLIFYRIMNTCLLPYP